MCGERSGAKWPPLHHPDGDAHGVEFPLITKELRATRTVLNSSMNRPEVSLLFSEGFLSKCAITDRAGQL